MIYLFSSPLGQMHYDWDGGVCHRIVAADGLGGFAGGATWKQKLLRLEGIL